MSNEYNYTYLNDSGFHAKGCLNAKEAYDALADTFYEKADRVFASAICMAGCAAVVYMLLGAFLSGAAAKVLGADNTVFDMTNTYLKVMLLFAPAYLFNHLLQCFVRNDGNILLGLEGNTGVAAFAVITVISLVVVAIYTGLSQGIQPIISLNHGAGNPSYVKSILKYALITVFLLSGTIYTVIFFGASQLVTVFNSENNSVLQALAVTGLRLYFLACPFIGFNIVAATYFTSTERPHPAQIISLLRGFFVLIPMAFLLSALLKMTGVWCAYPLTEFIVAWIGLAFYILIKRKERSK